MLRRVKQESSKVILIAVIFLVWGAMELQVQNSEVIAQAQFSAVEKFKAAGQFVDFMASQFQKSIFAKEMDYKGTVSIVAIPARKLVSVRDLTNGAIIGGLYLSSGSLRYNLPPGSYTVYVQGKGGKFWAEIRDDAGSTKRKRSVRVVLAESAKKITASIEYSICYRINGGIV